MNKITLTFSGAPYLNTLSPRHRNNNSYQFLGANESMKVRFFDNFEIFWEFLKFWDFEIFWQFLPILGGKWKHEGKIFWYPFNKILEKLGRML